MMKPKMIVAFFVAVVFLVPSVCGMGWAEDLPLVTAIEVKGLKRIDEGAVKSRLTQKLGEPLSQEKVSNDIKAIFKMGYFEDVNVAIEPFEGGIKAAYVVVEKPTIVKVDFQGNKEFDDKRLGEVVSVVPGAIADITLINDNATKLRVFYEDEGYYLAKVVPVVNKTTEGEVAVTYQISEAEKVKIKKINIENNKALSSGKITGAMKTTERGIFSFITGTGYYKKEEMRADIERIRDLYYNNGYLKIVVSEPRLKLTEDQKGLIITIAVSEGEQYTVSAVGISGNKAFPSEELQKLIKLSAPKVFSKEVVRGDVTAISDKYADSGYALVSVTPDLEPNDEKKDTKVTYRIVEGDKYRIGRIEISGNTKTLDKVIRREMRVNEGDTFNNSAIKRSYERLNNLQFFETVDINPKPKQEDKSVDLDIKVKEKSTGFLTIGGGYGSQDGLLAMVELTQNNLFGTGRSLSIRGELGGRMDNQAIRYRDPWFLDEPLMFGASIYKQRREYDIFERKAKGLEVSLGKNFWEYWFVNLAYNLEQVKILNVDASASNQIKDQEGTKVTSAISPSLVRDTRDVYLDPSRGSRNALYNTFAGLGGDNAFIRTVLESSWYFPAFWDTTFHVRGLIGNITGMFGKKIPLYERFYIGGIDTVRGLRYGDGGPKDENGDAIGGEREIVLNAELIFPIVKEYKFKGVVFADAGRAYDKGETIGSDLRYTAGAGIRWISPLGPLRVEWGYNLSKKEGESSSRVEFTFGSAF